MLLIRRFEEKAGQLYGMGKIGGFCHLYIGQEAVVVGMQSVAGPDDSVVTSTGSWSYACLWHGRRGCYGGTHWSFWWLFSR